MTTPLVCWFDETHIGDIALVGGKNASLGEMIGRLKSFGVDVPYGFAITTRAYEEFLQQNGIANKIEKILHDLDTDNLSELKKASNAIKKLILSSSFSDDLGQEIKTFYDQLRNGRQSFRVAVRSSASAEDLPGASFAGQQDTYLHVTNFSELMEKTKLVYASLFGERAIAYRTHNGFDHNKVHISVGVQEMVNSDDGASGVMFTLDPESGFPDAIFINAGYGLGEAVVSGAINPDEFLLHKSSVKSGRLTVLNKRLGDKAKKLVFNAEKGGLKEVKNSKKLRENYSLSDEDLGVLAKNALTIEEHYGRPMDIEWAKDGQTGRIKILQARPETVHSNKEKNTQESFVLAGEGTVLCEGRAVGKKIGQGRARVLKSIEDAREFQAGDILVTDMTDPNWEPIMQKAAAIVTDRGGRTCHAAIIARELGLPAVVGCHDATKKISDSSLVTVSCAEGDVGKIYEGLIEIRRKSMHFVDDKKHALPLMLIAANPSRALSYHRMPHKGIGLARLEFIIGNSIGIHPNAILQFDRMPKDIQSKILCRSKDFASPIDFYVETLARGISSLAALASPHPTIVRLSDFKTNEYEELIGGSHFEHKENNPMIGFRGACRYISPQFAEAFALECRALKIAREQHGFTNIEAMVPFVRTLNEAKLVVDAMARNGLKRGDQGLRIIMMCEVPSNVILADEFLQYFDGFSIGSNDLTQLTLGVDRDSHTVAGAFSESDPAMLKMLDLAITACKKANKYVGICGQGPSDDVKLAKWLLDRGIDSISLTPDTLLDTYMALS